MRSTSRRPPSEGARRWLGDENLRVARQYLSLGLAEILGAGCGFLAVLLVARSFGPSGLGMVSLAINLVGYATILTTCGTIEYSVRQVAGQEEVLALQVSSTGLLRLLLAVASYVSLVALVYASPPFESIRGLVAIFGLTLFSTAINLSWVAQALQRYTALAVAKLGLPVLNLAVLWLALLRWPRLESVAWSRAIAAFLVALGLVAWYYRRIGGGVGPLPTPRALVRMIKSSAPIAGTKLVLTLSTGSDLVVVGLLVSATDLGVYSAAVRIFLVLVALAGAYYLILLPRLVERRSSGPEALRGELVRSLRVALPTAAIALGVVAWVAEPLLVLLFGEEYASAAPALRWLCLALWVNVISMHLRHTLLALDRQRLDLGWTSIGAALHVGLKILLTILLGITGAAMATVLGEVFIAVALGSVLTVVLSRATPREDG